MTLSGGAREQRFHAGEWRGEERVLVQKDVTRRGIKRSTGKLKMGGTPGTDGIRAEWLNY